MLSAGIQILLGLIIIGSTAAFNAFVNSAAVTLYITYVSSATYDSISVRTLTTS